MNNFDPMTIPLAGRNLIEASAGTGKTYTICGLVLRLLLEKNLGIDEILVVTYTEAATEDLRDQVRRKLRGACEALQTGKNADPVLAALLMQYPEGEGLAGRARQKLNEALRNFDEAAIFTIHGFCQRMLKEYGVESNILFNTELTTDEESLTREIAEDFWRRNLYENPSLFADYCRRKFTPEDLLKFLKKYLAKSGLTIIPEIKEEHGIEIAGAEKNFRALYNELRQAWPPARPEVSQILLTQESLSKTKYKKENIPAWLAELDAMAAEEIPDPLLFDQFKKMTTGELAAATKKNCTRPSHSFFDLCEALQQAANGLIACFEQSVIDFKHRLLDFAGEELARQKEKKGVFLFDDLLLRLRQGLAGPNGTAMARIIAEKYPAALIDEFQDTDPVQYEIFSRIYTAESTAVDSGKLLFLIGDPKQAIYNFRGADIFTYMQAATDVAAEKPHTLVTNWRSTPGLISAINNIFSRACKPFIYEEIPFPPVLAADKDLPGVLTIDGRNDQPFRLWFLERPDKNDLKPISVGMAQKKILSALSAEILRLLELGNQGRALIDDHPLGPGDLAVLVRTNQEARLTRTALAASRIPNVIYSAESLFASHEASEMELLLAAISDPGSESRIKAALLTDIMGGTTGELDQFVGDLETEAFLEKYLTVFREASELWSRHGLIPMFKTFMAKNNISTRLLAFPDGERRMTNLTHLLEVLHRDALELHLDRSGLVAHLSERLASPPTHEDFQLRLESDADCVKIVTIHKAKGLEYPVVFCPFSWRGVKPQRPGNEFTFHHKEPTGYRLLLDLGSQNQKENARQAELEEMAENIRLLYVALTRARQRCYFAWGAIKGADTSAPAYLLHQPLAAEKFTGLSDQELLADLEDIAQATQGAIRISVLEEVRPGSYSGRQATLTPLACCSFSGKIANDWRITSFSAMIHDQHPDAELPEHDLFEAPDESTAEQFNDVGVKNIFTFPHGAGPGTFLHDLLERLDFTQPEQSNYVREKLGEYGFAPDWHKPLCGMIENLCAIPLHSPGESGDPGPKLAAIGNRQRLNELEFYFPLSPLTVDDLRRIFSKEADLGNKILQGFSRQLAQLDFPRVQGFLKGFIDLVFEHNERYYLIDWKSNFLGHRLEDYRQERLAEVMHKNFYTLQYHIYAVALHNYLKNRLAAYNHEKNFGGVFYIFLRGMDKRRGSDYGIFYDRPTAGLLEKLTSGLLNGSER